MTINFNGLTDKEQCGIAFFVSQGYLEGAIDNLHWSLMLVIPTSLRSQEDFDDVSEMIGKGSTSKQSWTLAFKRKNPMEKMLEDTIIEHLIDKNIDLETVEFENALNGVRHWLNSTLSEAVSDSVFSSTFVNTKV